MVRDSDDFPDFFDTFLLNHSQGKNLCFQSIDFLMKCMKLMHQLAQLLYGFVG